MRGLHSGASEVARARGWPPAFCAAGGRDLDAAIIAERVDGEGRERRSTSTTELDIERSAVCSRRSVMRSHRLMIPA